MTSSLQNFKTGDWDFDADAFANVLDEGKDFIKKLLVKTPQSLLTVHQALEHPWLKGYHSDRTHRIPSSRYDKIRAKIREKYADWPAPMPAIGRIANFSSLKKHRPKEYSIYDAYFGIVLMMTSPEDLATTIPKLKYHTNKEAGMLKGPFQVQDRKVSAVLQRIKIPEKTTYYRARRNKNQNNNESQQSYRMVRYKELELSSVGKKNGAKLSWISYSIRTLYRSTGEENISEFELDNKSYPPLISCVRSYAYDVDTPLML